MINSPLYRIEHFLDAWLNGTTPPEPLHPIEFFIAKLCGADVVTPEPISRADKYLAKLLGEDIEIPKPQTRMDFYLAAMCGEDVEIPEPLYRIEYWLAQLANSGELKTVTGNPISVSDALAMPAESLVIKILPQQDLHGYDNPWPAGGGKNLLPNTYQTDTINGVTFTVNSDGTILVNGTASARIDFYLSGSASGGVLTLPSGNYTITYGDAALSTSGLYMQYQKNGSAETVYGSSTFDASEIGWIRLIITNVGASINNVTIKPMIRLSSVSDATFSPYSNICPISGHDSVKVWVKPTYDPTANPTATIQLGQTVYGGTLDVTTGVLTVDRAYALLDDANLWVESSSSTTPYVYQYNFEDRKKYDNSYTSLMCSVMPVNPLTQSFTARWVGATSTLFGIKATNPELSIDVIKDLSSRGELSISYELATPQTIQLTPTEIEMLLGDNVIWNDVGDMVLEYLADGPADDIDALNILLNNRYVNNGEPDEATDKEALEILLGGNTR